GREDSARQRRRHRSGHDRGGAGAPSAGRRPPAGAPRRALPRAEGLRGLSPPGGGARREAGSGSPAAAPEPARHERLGIVDYTNVAPLHFSLRPWNDEAGSVEFVRGVPTVLNRALLSGDI